MERIGGQKQEKVLQGKESSRAGICLEGIKLSAGLGF